MTIANMYRAQKRYEREGRGKMTLNKASRGIAREYLSIEESSEYD